MPRFVAKPQSWIRFILNIYYWEPTFKKSCHQEELQSLSQPFWGIFKSIPDRGNKRQLDLPNVFYFYKFALYFSKAITSLFGFFIPIPNIVVNCQFLIGGLYLWYFWSLCCFRKRFVWGLDFPDAFECLFFCRSVVSPELARLWLCSVFCSRVHPLPLFSQLSSSCNVCLIGGDTLFSPSVVSQLEVTNQVNLWIFLLHL